MNTTQQDQARPMLHHFRELLTTLALSMLILGCVAAADAYANTGAPTTAHASSGSIVNAG